MFAKAPERQRGRRFYLRLAGGALLILVAWFWFGRKAEPLVAGQSVAYWLDRVPAGETILPDDHPLATAGPEIGPALLAALQRNYAIRDFVTRSRGFLPRFLRPQRLPAPAGLIRPVAAFRLGLMGAAASNAVPTLIGMLQKPTAEVGDKGRINQALGWIGPAAKQAVPALVAQLTDPNEWIRMTAAYSLLQIGVPPEAAPALQQHLTDTGHVAALMAVALLGAQPTPEALARVELRLTTEGDGNTRAHVAAALGWLPEVPGQLKQILTRMLEEPNGSVRQGAAIGLARPHAEPLPRIVERLREGLREGQFQIRCAEALGKLGTDAAAARSDLAHAQGYVKKIIARAALAKIGTDGTTQRPSVLEPGR